jgi:hypothetical protein
VDLLPTIGINLGSFEDFDENTDFFLEQAQIQATNEGILFPILAVASWDDGIYREHSESRLIILSCDLDADIWDTHIAGPFNNCQGNVYLWKPSVFGFLFSFLPFIFTAYHFANIRNGGSRLLAPLSV